VLVGKDQDLMAHAEGWLTRDQLDALRRRLEEERSRILAVLRAPTVASYDERSEAEEVAQRTAEQDERVELTDRERALLSEVERALEKLRTGTYGVDERTGEPIAYARLAAIPWARGAADEEGASAAP
jgi:DnaK suppressor protein